MVKINFNQTPEQQPQTEAQPTIAGLRMSDAAADRLAKVLAKHAAAYLRITVKGGGAMVTAIVLI
jgi:hypothetical protein